MLSNSYDKTASVERLTTTTGSKKAYLAHLASVPCLIQPLTDEVASDLEGSFGKDFLMLSPSVDIAEGDRITIDTDEYRVIATEALNFGSNPHRETRLRIFKSS